MKPEVFILEPRGGFVGDKGTSLAPLDEDFRLLVTGASTLPYGARTAAPWSVAGTMFPVWSTHGSTLVSSRNYVPKMMG